MGMPLDELSKYGLRLIRNHDLRIGHSFNMVMALINGNKLVKLNEGQLCMIAIRDRQLYYTYGFRWCSTPRGLLVPTEKIDFLEGVFFLFREKFVH